MLALSFTLIVGCTQYSTKATPRPLLDSYYAIGDISSNLEDIRYQINFNRQVSDFLGQFNIYGQTFDELYIVDSTLYSMETSSVLQNSFGNSEISRLTVEVLFSVTPSQRSYQAGVTKRQFSKTYEAQESYNVDSNIVETNINSIEAFSIAIEDILFDFRVDLIEHAASIEQELSEQRQDRQNLTIGWED